MENTNDKYTNENVLKGSKLSETKHTPTPWKVINDYEIVTQNNRFISTCLDGSGLEGIQDKYNADLIVRAVNSHEALLAIAKRFLGLMDRGDIELDSEIEQETLADAVRDIVKQAEG